MAPFKISKTKVEAICTSVENGAPIEAASLAAGIEPRTYYRWQQTGEAVLQERASREAEGKKARKETQVEQLCVSLCQGVLRARGVCEEKLVGVAMAAAIGRPAKYDEKSGRLLERDMPPDGRVALEMLGRKYPERWSKRIKVTDDSNRPPAPVRTEAIAYYEEAWRKGFPEALEGVAPENLVPALFSVGETEDEDGEE
jgi:hypothetical protein